MNNEEKPLPAVDVQQPGTQPIVKEQALKSAREPLFGWFPRTRTKAAKNALNSNGLRAEDIEFFVAALEHDDAVSRSDDSSLIAIAAIGVAFMAFGTVEPFQTGGTVVTLIAIGGFLLNIGWRRGRTSVLLRLYDARTKLPR